MQVIAQCLASQDAEPFATQELKIVLATVLQRYRLAVVPDARISTNVAMRPTHLVWTNPHAMKKHLYCCCDQYWHENKA